MFNHSPYTLDLNWVWGPQNPNLENVATLRATVSNPEVGEAKAAVNRWSQTIETGSLDTYWEGGWAATIGKRSDTSVQIELSSAGQDVADGLTAAIESLEDAVLGGGTVITWEPQPIGPGAPL